MKTRLRLSLLVAAGVALFVAACNKSEGPAGSERIRIGFLVNQPEEAWFQLEWKFADMAAREFGFTLKKIGATDGEKVLAAIDNLAASGAQGFIICPPDTRLGPAIVSRAQAASLKVINIDDQFVGSDGEPMRTVPYHGLSARKVGEDVGRELAKVMKSRGWTFADTAVCAVTFDELLTAKERTDGAVAVLRDAGFPDDRIFAAAQRVCDIPSAFDAVNALLNRAPRSPHWLVCGVNDSAVLGAVRALESRGYGADTAAGIGINGTECIIELEKEKPTAFFGSMLLSPRQHGYDTSVMMFNWIRHGIAPPLDSRTTGVFITRDNFRAVLKEQGIVD